MNKRRTKIDRNINIEILRFLLTIAVCCHHFRMYSDSLPFGGGYIAVDFFFIISGFFMTNHLSQNLRQDRDLTVFSYILDRYMRLFPDYIMAFLIAFMVRLFVLREIVFSNIIGYVKEAFMFEIGCLPIWDRINPPDWYVGYLLLASIIAFMILKYSKMRRLWWSGILSLFIYGMLAIHSKGINIYPQNASIIHIAVIRGVAGLLMGCFLWWIKEKKNNRNFGKEWASRILALILGFVIFYVLLWDNSFPYIDYIIIILFCILFLVLNFAEPIFSSTKIYKIAMLMGKISYTIYLNHYIIASLFTKYGWLQNYDWKIFSVCYLAVVIFASVITFLLMNFVLSIKIGE